LGLRDLIALDGFDGVSSVREDVWIQMVCNLEIKLNLSRSHSICDIGCGSGAFLLPLYDKGYRRLAGIDISPGLIAICKKVMPQGDFRISEAHRVPFNTAIFDVVFCNSVFQYFPDLAYAENAMREMIRILKPNSQAVVLDINDAWKKDLYETARRSRIGSEYDRLYRNHPHLFFERSWFVALAKKYHLEYEIVDQSIPGYLNSPFRFNFQFRKLRV
jgi:ubiquinone/menaquinone biosynthesis C-methylase UbiE